MKTLAMTMVVMLLTFVLHQSGHAGAALAFGYDVVAGLGQVGVDGGYRSTGDAVIVALMGPLVTIAVALFAAVIARAGKSLTAFWFVYAAFIHRLVDQAMSVNEASDEMRAGTMAGLGAWTLPLAVTALLLVVMVWAGRGARPGLARLILASAGISVVLTGIGFGADHLPSLRF